MMDLALRILEAAGVGGAGLVEFQRHCRLGLVIRIPKLDMDESRLGDPVVPFPLLMELPVPVEIQW